MASTSNIHRSQRMNAKSRSPQGLPGPQNKNSIPNRRVARTISADASCEMTERKRKLNALREDQHRHKKKKTRVVQKPMNGLPDLRFPDLSFLASPSVHTQQPPRPLEPNQPETLSQTAFGDSVLMSIMAPDHPDVALEAQKHQLDWFPKQIMADRDLNPPLFEPKPSSLPTGHPILPPPPLPGVAPKRRYQAIPNSIISRPLAPHRHLTPDAKDVRCTSKGKHLAMSPQLMPHHGRRLSEHERETSRH